MAALSGYISWGYISWCYAHALTLDNGLALQQQRIGPGRQCFKTNVCFQNIAALLSIF